jgi:hypothetical protein
VGTGDLADIVGVQLAWWQLGFRARRAVLRRARYGGSGPGDEVGRAWALQVLLAPWWWRAARTAAAAAAASIVVVIAEVGLLPQINDATIAVLLTVLLSIGVTAALTRRQTRWARTIAGPAGQSARPQIELSRQLRVGLALVFAVAVLATFLQASADTVSSDIGCEHYYADPHLVPVLAQGSGGVGRCPLADSHQRIDGVAWVQLSNGDVVYWIPSLGAAFTMAAGISAVWLQHPELGMPRDIQRPDGDSVYVNFVNGSVVRSPDLPVLVTHEFHEPRLGPETCSALDRPCLTTAVQDSSGAIQLDWQYSSADGYNVSYWIVGQPTSGGTEVARPHFTVPAPVRGVVYGFTVQACAKHFLRRSTCSPASPAVAVRTAS